MRNIGIRYYKMGFYTNEQFALFVKRGFVTPEEYKEMTGVDYDPESTCINQPIKVGFISWRYYMLTNVLNLNDSNDGNRIKQGDLSIMRYILTDSNDDDLEIKDKPAKAYLINSKGVQYIYETKVNKEKSSYVVDLVIDKILPSDVYTLEIWVDNQYCFLVIVKQKYKLRRVL